MASTSSSKSRKRLTAAEKTQIIEALIKAPRDIGSSYDIADPKSKEILVGCDIHFVIEHNDNDGHGWVGVYWSDSPFREVADSLRDLDARDYKFFGALAAVRYPGPEPFGMPLDASAMAQRAMGRWGEDGHSHSFLPLHEFIKRKILTEENIRDAATAKLTGDDPVATFLDARYIDEPDFTLYENTRVVFWFDN